jgi:hypothetical protein
VRARGSSGSSTGTGVSSVWTAFELNTCSFISPTSGPANSAHWLIQPHMVWRDNSTPWRWKISS